MLLAMVLLSSVSVFAQSGGNEPLKGDVNEDGTVDVADIVSVIKIMKDSGGAAGEKTYYWYAGTEVVTTDNFTDVASKIPESEIPEAGSVTAAGQYIYFVMPETMRLASLELVGGSAIDFECTDVMGYRIYKTSSQVNGQVNYSIEQTKYYWYVGTTAPTDPSNSAQNTGNNKWTQLTSTPSQLNIESNMSVGTWYVAIPHKYGFQAYDSTGSFPDAAAYNKSQITINSVSYDLFTSANQMLKVNAIFKP